MKFIPRIIGILSLSILAPISSCDLVYKCGECFTPPESIRLKVVNSVGENLITIGQVNKDSLKLFYFENQQKKNVQFFVIPNLEYFNIITSDDMAWLSVDAKKDFYLYLNYLDTDTLSLELTVYSDGCCTSHPIKSFFINGKPAEQSAIDYAFLIKK